MLLNTTNNNFLLERNKTIQWLNKNGFPSLPVAPQQDPYKYPRKDKNGKIECESDCKTPKPLYTGKNPSYLDKKGIPHLIQHRKYQDKLPTSQEIKTWFAHPDNGVGTLGGWNKTVWLDFDVKHFNSPQDCKHTILQWLEHNPPLQKTFFELTHSGGFRLGIKVTNQPDFTNFALSPGGKHVGEVLSGGRFTVLSPTIGPSGNAYKSIRRGELIEVENLESIGIYPSSKRNYLAPVLPLQTDFVQAGIPLEKLLANKAKNILDGDNPTGDRSEALTALAHEAFGWQNWCNRNKILLNGNAQDIVLQGGNILNIDDDRVHRIINSIDLESSQPSAQFQVGEEKCWLKIRQLDKGIYDIQCPSHIKLILSDINNQHSSNPNYSNIKSTNNNKTTEVKLTQNEAIERAKTVINKGLDELEENLQLEKIRQQAGFSDYFWERKIVAPLRRNSLSSRLKLEIIAYLRETDPQRQITERNRILSRYHITIKEFEQQCQAIRFAEKQNQQKPQPLTLKEVFALENEGLSWLAEGIIPKGVSGILSGLPGAAKTLLTTDLAYSIVTGNPFLGENTRKGKVLMINSDQPLNITANYLSNRGFDNEPNIRVIGETRNMAAWTIKDLESLELWLEEFQPDLVIIDSIRATIINPLGIEEKSEYIGHWLKEVERLVIRYGATLLWVHHDNKNKDDTGVSRASGSTAIAGSVSFHYRIEKASKDQSDPHRIFSMAKTRGYEPVTLKLMYDATTGVFQNLGHIGESLDNAQQSQSLRQRILEFLDQHPGVGYEPEEIQNAVGGNNIGVELCKMYQRGMVSKRKSPNNPRRKVYLRNTTQSPLPNVSVPLANQNSEIIPEQELQTFNSTFNSVLIKKSEGEELKVQNQEAVVISPVLTTTLNSPQGSDESYNSSAPKIAQGMRVVFRCLGSKRDGKVAVVNSLTANGEASITFEDTTLPQHLRDHECLESFLEPLEAKTNDDS
ncbi:MAG TPA: AAA family ATPase [Trichormus sp. M33_DOE_039]|nr:AAA family ATPase [Trichormus sp. M33_DOE_039]